MPRPSGKVGVVSTEFFDARAGGFGGFGWAARASGLALKHRRPDALHPVLLGARRFASSGEPLTSLGGLQFIPVDAADDTRPTDLSLLLGIDFRPSHQQVMAQYPTIPWIVWVRDPRTPEDMERIQTLRVPGDSTVPKGLRTPDCRLLGELASRDRDRPLLFASPLPAFRKKAEQTFGTAIPELMLLPNPVCTRTPGMLVKNPVPRVLFLGRLDPIKRPWLYVELAKRFPRVEFIMLGGHHFSGSGTWQPGPLPSNVKWLGHLEGRKRDRVIASSWLLVNTSIHEGLAVSFLEAFLHEAPVVSCQNPGGVVERFGQWTGTSYGTGMDSLDSFAHALEALLDDHPRRIALGQAARAWVEQTHSRRNFLKALSVLEGHCESAFPRRDV
jgi:glycosyltransferase involved in cell wall biosynthesis